MVPGNKVGMLDVVPQRFNNSPMASVAQVPTTRPTVLLVEDDEMLRRVLARTLDDAGCRVLQAENGDVALAIARRLSRAVALVLSDINMPVMNGLEFAKRFRPLYPSVPILFMTGALPVASDTIPLREVAARLLLKPFGPEVLLEVVRSMLTHGPAARRTIA
jgi:two-component system, cell cycle sensor histidine kinase and response regulator CckA